MAKREELGVSALIRVNPMCGFEKGSVVTDLEYNEVSFYQPETAHTKKKSKQGSGNQQNDPSSGPQKKTFSFDAVLDDLKKHTKTEGKKSNKKEKDNNVFASQVKVWEVFEKEMDRRMQDGSSDIGVVAFGMPGSGKTHTLFGGSSKKERGLLPRFVEKSFKEGWTGSEKGGKVKFTSALLSMYVSIGEHLIDIFRMNNPVSLHIGHQNCAYSDTIGPLLLPVEYVCCDSASECNGFISLGLRVAAAIITSHTEVYSSASIHVRMLMVSQEKDFYKVNFVEAPSCNAPKVVPVNVDRLSGASQLYTACRELYDGIKEAASNSIDSISYTREMLRDNVRRSITKYALQDVIWRHPDCISIVCCRGGSSHYDSNVKVCELVDAIWANQLRVEDIKAIEEASVGRDQITNDHTSPSSNAIGPKTISPLKEVVSLLQGEAKVCRLRIAEIDENVRQIRTIAAEKFAAMHGHDGVEMPPLPPPRPKTNNSGDSSMASAGTLPRRDRKIHPIYEYTPPEVPLQATGAEKDILVLQSEQALLESKEAYLSKYSMLLCLLLRGGERGTKDSADSGIKECKYRLNHAPIFQPTFPTARPPHNYLLFRDAEGDPYDSDEEERAQKVRYLRDFGLQEMETNDPRSTPQSTQRKGNRGGKVGLQYFAQVLQEWLLERGYSVPSHSIPYDSSLDVEKQKLPSGGLDLSMFSSRKAQGGLRDDEEDDEDDEDNSKSSAGGTGKGVKGSSSGTEDLSLSQSIPWCKTKDNPCPYLVPMSPHSGLQEHYAKLSIAPGKVLVIRGVSGVSIGLQQCIDGRYSSTPIDTDSDKDQTAYLEALGDLMGEGLLPVEDYYEGEEKELEKAEQARQAAAKNALENSSIAGISKDDEDDDEDARAERLEKEKQELLEKRKKEDNRAIMSALVNGPDVAPLHCFFKCENQKNLTVRPNTIVSSSSNAMSFGLKGNSGNTGPLVTVNGKTIKDTVSLTDMDVVRVGLRYFLVRIPIKLKRANDPVVVEEKLLSMTKWELCLLRSHMDSLRHAIHNNLLTRLHLNHSQTDRSLLSILKQPDKTKLNSVPTYDIPAEVIDHIYKGVSLADRVYLCQTSGACEAFNTYSRLMRRGFSVELALGETSSKDQKYRKVVYVDTPPVDIFTKPVDPEAMKNNVDYVDAVHSSRSSATSLLGTVTNTGNRVPVKYKVKDKDKDGAIAQHQVLSGYVVCTTTDSSSSAGGAGSSGKFIWNPEVAEERLYLLLLMYRSFNAWWCARDPSWLNILYPPALDPTNDAQEDELIGVGYLYLDSFQHFVDVNDIVPLVSVEGSKVGHLKVRGRVWIDKMETSPNYLTVDSEKHIRDFENRLCVMRLYFESLIDLPESKCSSTYVKFNYFYHSKPYTTLRHGGMSTHPFLHSAVKIEQRITGDFLEYIDRGSLELEVYGKRKKVSGPAVQALASIAAYKVGETVLDEEAEADEEDDEEEKLDGNEEEKQAMSEAELMVQTLASKLERTEENLARSKELASKAIAEKKDMERKLAALRASMDSDTRSTGSSSKRGARGVSDESKSSICVIC